MADGTPLLAPVAGDDKSEDVSPPIADAAVAPAVAAVSASAVTVKVVAPAIDISVTPPPAISIVGAGSAVNNSDLKVPLIAGAAGGAGGRPLDPYQSVSEVVLKNLAAAGDRHSYSSGGSGSGVFRMDIGFKELGLELLSTGQRVLSGVTGEIRHGRLTAVMGPSGSGKTTFLTTLAGRAGYGKAVGSILINKRPDSLTNYRKLVGFVPQEDVMIRELSVEQNIRHAALSRLPTSMSLKEQERMIERTLKLLGLTEIRHSIIGDELTRGISGGQRKRVNVALELVADPVVLFLDEPTSGLDSSSSFEVCRVLQRVAHELQLTVVAVIHQPRYEIFTMFDDVLLLAKGGFTVYLGETQHAESYLTELGFACPAKVNPSDHAMDVISIPANSKRLTDEWATRDGTKAAAARLAAAASPKGKHDPDAEADKLDPFDNCQFALGCLLGPIALFATVWRGQQSLGKRRSSLLGALYWFFAGATSGFGTALMLLAFSTDWDGDYPQWIVYAFIWGLIWFGTLNSIRLVRRNRPRLTEDDMDFAIFFFISFMFIGPGGLLYTYYRKRSNAKSRMGAIAGFGSQLLAMGSFYITIYAGFLLHFGSDADPGDQDKILLMMGVFLLTIGVVMTVVFHHRLYRMPTRDRDTPGFWRQTWLCATRGFMQQLYGWKGIVFDLCMCLLSGLFLGVIFYKKEFVPGLPAFIVKLCPDNFRALCEQPNDDPFFGQSSLTTLSISLAAIASSMRIFGAEKSVFARESEAAQSTEAYYFGKTLSHLPTTLLAPLCFAIPFYSLAEPGSTFIDVYALAVAIYFTTAGFAFFISILFKTGNAQLIGVLAVLVSMMFGGAQPRLPTLADHSLLGGVLYYPTYVSYVRWSGELYYLNAMRHFRSDAEQCQMMSDYYQYSFSDIRECWIAVMSIAGFVRLLAYVFLVKKEP